MSKERTVWIRLKDTLLAAASRGKRIRIETPWYTYDGVPGVAEVEQIYREFRRAGDDHFRPEGRAR